MSENEGFYMWSNAGLMDLIRSIPTPTDPAPLNLEELFRTVYDINRSREQAQRLHDLEVRAMRFPLTWMDFLGPDMPTENRRNVQYYAINPDGTTDPTIRDATGDPVVANDRNAARRRDLERQQEEVIRPQRVSPNDIPAMFNEWHVELPPPAANPWTTRPQPRRDADGDPIINTTGQENRITATEVRTIHQGLVEEMQNYIAPQVHREVERLYVSEPLGQWPGQPKILDFIFHDSGWTEVARDYAPDVLDRSCIMDTGMDTVTPEFIKEDLACIKKHQPKITIVVCAAANKVFFRSDTYWPDVIETAYAKKQQLSKPTEAQASVDQPAVPNIGAVFHGPPF